MSKHVSPRDPGSKPETDLATDDPWLDDKTTAQYKRPKRQTPQNEPETEAAPIARPDSPPRTEPKKLLRLSLATLTLVSAWMFYWLVLDPRPSAATEVQPTLTALQPVVVEQVAPRMTPPQAPISTTVEASAGQGRLREAKPRRNAGKPPATTRVRKKHPHPTDSENTGLPATLSIDSQPWSEVTIDEVPLGRTPQRSVSLQPGRHKVRLYSPQLSVLKLITLHVLPGESIERVEQLVSE